MLKLALMTATGRRIRRPRRRLGQFHPFDPFIPFNPFYNWLEPDAARAGHNKVKYGSNGSNGWNG